MRLPHFDMKLAILKKTASAGCGVAPEGHTSPLSSRAMCPLTED